MCFRASWAFQQVENIIIRKNTASSVTYLGEDDQFYTLSDGSDLTLVVPKNRSVPETYARRPRQPLFPAFHFLIMAFFGLAPAGLGAIIFAPLAAFWAILVFITQPLSRADRFRVLVVLVISAVLLGLAIPLCRLFSALLSK